MTSNGKAINIMYTNMAETGTATDRAARKEAAITERQWDGCGQEVGTEVWRVFDFNVHKVPGDEEHQPTMREREEPPFGTFCSGDSYVVLNTYKKGRALNYNAHFWIGESSTQDEYGTAAYKTVELSSFLDDRPKLYREVEKHESEMFKGYFKNFQTIDEGNPTAFKSVIRHDTEEYRTSLFHIRKEDNKRKTVVRSVAPNTSSLNDDDSFVIDTKDRIYVYHGKLANNNERYCAQTKAEQISKERNLPSSRIETINNGNNRHSKRLAKALSFLGQTFGKFETNVTCESAMFRVSDSTGRIMTTKIARGDDVTRDRLTPDDVYIIITGKHCYAWVGKGASVDEKRCALLKADECLRRSSCPALPASVEYQGRESDEFNAAVPMKKAGQKRNRKGELPPAVAPKPPKTARRSPANRIAETPRGMTVKGIPNTPKKTPTKRMVETPTPILRRSPRLSPCRMAWTPK